MPQRKSYCLSSAHLLV